MPLTWQFLQDSSCWLCWRIQPVRCPCLSWFPGFSSDHRSWQRVVVPWSHVAAPCWTVPQHVWGCWAERREAEVPMPVGGHTSVECSSAPSCSAQFTQEELVKKTEALWVSFLLSRFASCNFPLQLKLISSVEGISELNSMPFTSSLRSSPNVAFGPLHNLTDNAVFSAI